MRSQTFSSGDPIKMADRGGLLLLQANSSPILTLTKTRQQQQNQQSSKMIDTTAVSDQKKTESIERGEMINSSTSNHDNNDHASILEATVLNRLSKCKIADDCDQQNDHIGGKCDDKSDREKLSSPVSSGIGSEEVSPFNSGSISANSSKDISSTATSCSSNRKISRDENNIDQQQQEKPIQLQPPPQRRFSVANPPFATTTTGGKAKEGDESKINPTTTTTKNSTDNDNDQQKQDHQQQPQPQQHAQSLTLPPPISKFPPPRGGAGLKADQKGGHLSPAEFFQMSRLRATALANKMNTAATFGGSSSLVTDALLKKTTTTTEDHPKAVDALTKKVNDALKLADEDEEGKTKGKKGDEEAAEGELIGRSPVPVYSNNRHVQHPYRPQQQHDGRQAGAPQATNRPTSRPPADISPQQQHQARISPAEYLRQQRRPAGGPFSGGAGSPMVRNENNNVNMGADNHQHHQQQQVPMIPSDFPGVNSPFESSALDDRGSPSAIAPDQSAAAAIGGADCELPEALCDFILKYSRRYSTSSTATDAGRARSGLDSGHGSSQPSPMSTGRRGSNDGSLSGDESGLEEDRMSTVSMARPDSGSGSMSSVFVDSPMSMSSIGSPAAPTMSAGHQQGQQQASKYRPLRPKQQNGGHHSAVPPAQLQASQPMAGATAAANNAAAGGAGGSKAKKRLREMISQQDFDAAWAWAMRCCQACPGSLLWRDADGDTLLHIVIWHKDLAKTYAITEILMKDDQPATTKPYDLPNKLEETPLFLAVEKRCVDVVAYLLECGANPNLRARNQDGDGPLHYAAARGMLEIVQLFCQSTRSNFNILNGSGMTPLLCAVKNHGVIEEESQCLVNNQPTIRTLLKAGADPTIPDVASGKSVLHYAVECMDPDLVELICSHLSKDPMNQLVNMPDYNGDTALHYLTRMSTTNSIGGGSLTTSHHHQFPSHRQGGMSGGEEGLKRKMLNTLIDCGADVGQCAGGFIDVQHGGFAGDVGGGGGGGSIVVLYPANGMDDIQFTVLDDDLPPEKFN